MSIAPRVEKIHSKNLFISCIVPVFNEEANVSSFFEKLHQKLMTLSSRFEIVVIDDGSLDNTVRKILLLPDAYGIKLIKFSRNFGKENALTAGLEHCAGDVAVIMDADFQHPISVISEFLSQWGKGFDMVYGVRTNRDNESVIKRNFARLFYWLMAKITKIDVPNNAGDFRLLDRKVINAIKSFKERTRFMKGLYAWVGFSKVAVPFEVQDRAAGSSSWGLSRLTELAITGITCFSNVPLRVWGFIGFIISSITFIYAMYVIIYTLIFGPDLPGFPTIIVAVLFLGGIQLLSIGILGEYIARIFTEVKQRPKYIIDEKYGFND